MVIAMNNLTPDNYQSLKEQIKTLLGEGRRKAIASVNTLLVRTYWHIGKHIVEFEQNGETKAAYGKELLTKLSKDLTLEYGKGFSRSNLTYMRKLYLAFPKRETLSHRLSWSHYFEILKSDNRLGFNLCLKFPKIQTLSEQLSRSHYAITNKLFVSKYQLYLPEKERLIEELNKILDNAALSN